MTPSSNGSGYDGEVQMFAEAAREVDLARLRFLRWLAEQGRLEHETAGDSRGEFAADTPLEHTVTA